MSDTLPKNRTMSTRACCIDPVSTFKAPQALACAMPLCSIFIPAHTVVWWSCLIVMSINLYGCGATMDSAGLSNDNQSAPDQDSEASAIIREIEEADIIKLEGDLLYLSNPYTGLRIIDVSDMNAPTLRGRAPLSGRGVELYVHENLAYVFTSADYYYCAAQPVGFDDSAAEFSASPDYTGSRLWVLDVSDPDLPTQVASFDFDGYVTTSRRVGEVLYIVGNLSSNWEDYYDDDSIPYSFGNGVFITSLNIADPQNIQAVESETFSGTSLDIYVSQQVLYVLGDDPELSQTTLVTTVDISDPAGVITPRDQFRVPGILQSRFFVDEYDNQFRVITDEWDFSSSQQVVALYVYDVSDLADVQRVGELPIVTDEDLRAVRFDGPRGYAVTFFQTDPLFVLDLSNAAEPKLVGELVVPGYSTHLVPMGEQLLGVGWDNQNGWRPTLSLYDVANPQEPRELSRLILGEFNHFSAESEATVDEKAMKVLPDAGLILMPYSWYDYDQGEYHDELQLVELKPTQLVQRGTLAHRGLVRRADLLEGQLWLLSDQAFQTADVGNLDTPVSLAKVELISEQEVLDAGLSYCLDSARWSGDQIGMPFVDDTWGPADSCGSLAWLLFLLMTLSLTAMKRRV
ncbi:MAG: hypothetical protein HJJLKODD_00288 [Phycisphaerae bacterium]|nr:hypothetical protein [Phycisphaerae bacterium]